MAENIKTGNKPFGRDEVMASILEAASDLFARRGVAAVSIRDIAARAGVNHGLVHRHFGTKENLRLAVQNKLAEDIRADIGRHDTFEAGMWAGLEALYRHEGFWRMLARTFLDGDFEGDVQSGFPFVSGQVALVEKAQQEGLLDPDIDPRMVTAGGLAMVLGMLVFEQYILQGTGLDPASPKETLEKLVALQVEMLTRRK